MKLVDIGVNLTDKSFRQDVDEVIHQAVEVGVEQLVVTGTTIRDSEQAITLARRYPGQVSCTAGIHPHYVKKCDSNTIEQLTRLAQEPEVKAVGECGLDFNRMLSPQQVQIDWFEQQLDLAITLQKPVFLHQRDAHDAFMQVLAQKRDQLTGVVVHCFTGTKQEMDDYLELDCFIGVTGWVCDERRGHELQQAVPHIPLNRLLLETDAPYLLPRDLKLKPKSRRNVPVHLPHICTEVARLRQQSVADVAEASWQNSLAFFGLR